VKINRPASRYLQLASRWRAHDQRLHFSTLRAWVRCERDGGMDNRWRVTASRRGLQKKR